MPCKGCTVHSSPSPATADEVTHRRRQEVERRRADVAEDERAGLVHALGTLAAAGEAPEPDGALGWT